MTTPCTRLHADTHRLCKRSATDRSYCDMFVGMPVWELPEPACLPACKLDAQLLRTAKRLKLIIQYGVGVEGIEIPVVRLLEQLSKQPQYSLFLGELLKDRPVTAMHRTLPATLPLICVT